MLCAAELVLPAFCSGGTNWQKPLGKLRTVKIFLTLDNTTELRALAFSLVPLFSLTLIPDWTWNSNPGHQAQGNVPARWHTLNVAAHHSWGWRPGCESALWSTCPSAMWPVHCQQTSSKPCWYTSPSELVNRSCPLGTLTPPVLWAPTLCQGFVLTALSAWTALADIPEMPHLAFQWAVPGYLPFQCSLSLPLSIFSISVFLLICPLLLIRFIVCLLSSVKCRVHEGF